MPHTCCVCSSNLDTHVRWGCSQALDSYHKFYFRRSTLVIARDSTGVILQFFQFPLHGGVEEHNDGGAQ
jgi:hypothetical protein